MAQAISNHETTVAPFDPSPYITSVRGGKYLPVAARIAWFRHDHPDGIVEVNDYLINEQRAIFRARVATVNGGIAEGWGSCTPEEFRDGYIEKASTKALGRALGALGYGTIESGDYAELESPSDMAEGPVGGQSWSNGNPQSMNSGGASYSDYGQRGDMATMPQKSRISRLANERNMNGGALDRFIHEHAGTDIDGLTKRQASGIIDALESERGGSPQGAPQPPQGNAPPRQMNGDEMTRPQFGKIAGIARDRGIAENDLAGWVQQESGHQWPHLTKREASAFLDQLTGDAAPF